MRIDNGALRDASPEEIAAARAQLSDMATATPDFAAMNKTEIENWARNRHGVNLDRRRRKEALILEARALQAG